MKTSEFWLKFALVFVGLYVLFLGIDLNSLKLLVAASSAGLLKLFGVQLQLSGNTLIHDSIRYVIVPSCTGVVGFSLFAGLVAAAPVKPKAKYLLAAFPLFVAWNVVRVAATVVWSEAHFWLWLATVAIVLVLFDWMADREKIKLG